MNGNESMNGSSRNSQAGSQDRELSIRDVWMVLMRNRWRVLLVTAILVVLGVIYTSLQDRIYESTATLQIDTNAQGFSLVSELGPLAGAAGAGGGMSIETELLVIKSRRIAEQVVDTLALHVVLDEPALPRTAVFEVVVAPRSERLRRYQLELQQGGAYQVTASTPKRDRSRLADVRIGEIARLEDLQVILNPELSANPPQKIEIVVAPFRDAVEHFQRTLQASRPSRDVQIVSVGYRHTDPALAAGAANAVATHYIRHRSRAARSETQGTVDFLREQVQAYEDQLRGAETSLRQYREQAQVISPREEATEQVRRLAELQAQRDALQSDRDALAQLLARIRAQPAGARGVQSPYRQLASFPIFLANPAVQNMLQSITELENQRSQLMILRTPENRDVVAVNERIGELEMQLYQTGASYLESLNGQLASLQANLGRFGGELEQIPARELQFARLAREQSLLEGLYNLLQTRLKEAEIREAVSPLEVQVLDPALVPVQPVAPRPVRTVALALIFGLVLGTGLAFGREALDTRVRTEDEVRGIAGGVPVIGRIPNSRGRARSRSLARMPWQRRVTTAAPEEFLDHQLVARSDPLGAPAEAYRTLRTNLTFANVESPPRLIVVTSATSGEGKTTTSANLAITLAQQGTPVLLVDADLRLGNLHELLDRPMEPGLAQLLAGQCTLEEAVSHVTVGSGETLHFLPVGAFPPNPAEMLGSERMATLLTRLRDEYSVVIVDGPPLGAVTDSALLGMNADVTLMVARSGVTEKAALQRAIGQLRHVRARLGGIVLNGTEPGEHGAYGYSATGASGNGRG
jgi:tyrosine-protein kinase Etk/Wzc